MLFTKTDVSRTILIIVSFCPHLFQDCIDVFSGDRLAQLIKKIAEALVDGDANPCFVWEVQVPERLEHVILINGFYLHLRQMPQDLISSAPYGILGVIMPAAGTDTKSILTHSAFSRTAHSHAQRIFLSCRDEYGSSDGRGCSSRPLTWGRASSRIGPLWCSGRRPTNKNSSITSK